MQRSITYFEDITQNSTGSVLRKIRKVALEEGITKIVLASTSGDVAARALDFFGDDPFELIIVPHQFDFMTNDTNRFPDELVQKIREKGHKVHFGTMLFHTDKIFAHNAPTVAANFLRTFGEGTKVCIEISLMAADAGLVSQKDKIIAAAGTGRGLDTALVLRPSSSQNLNRLRVSEIICKPLLLNDAEGGYADKALLNEEPAFEAIFKRRSHRNFAQKKIDEQMITAIIGAGAAAPSAHGKQPFRFARFDDPQTLAAVVAKFPWFAPAAKSGANILVLGNPELCVNREYWVVDCAAATQNMLLAAHAFGLGSLWMGIAPVEDNIANFSALVALPEGLVPFSLVALGYPEDESLTEKKRPSLDNFLVSL